jgi:TnpA family transposase
LGKLSGLPVSEESLAFLPAVKRKQFFLEAKSLDASRMQALGEKKRFTLACCLILASKAKCLDDLGEMFIKRMMKIHNNGQEALNRYHQENQATTDALLTNFHDVLTAYQEEGSIDARFKGVTQAIGQDPQALLEKVRTQMAYAGNNYFYFLWSYYKNYRSLLFDLIESVTLVSTTQESSIEAVIQFLKEHKLSRAEWIDCPATLPLTWIPDKWMKLIREPKDENGMTKLCRRHFEVCAFSQIMWELKSGDLAIVGSEQFSDYRNQLISWQDYEAAVDNYAEQAGISAAPAEFIASIKDWLSDIAQAVDKAFPDNEAVRIEDGRPVLTRLKKKSEPQRLQRLERLISSHMPHISILDVLVDTEHWLHWTKLFGPLSGFDSKIEEAAARYVITTFCYGCNLGPTQTARSIRELDRRQIAWINQRHVTETKLEQAITAVINAYNLFPLPKIWGSGKSASADGTRWNLYEQNLLSEYHIRYGGYGGIGYYHVSDTYIALFSHFIPCGVWEAVYILDGLLKNKSDIQPDVLHADTQGQSAPVFALAHLLGIKLMPRIRNWKDMKLFRSDRKEHFKHIDGLFSDECIDWKLIETHLPDMLRVVLSIKQGRVTASTILRRLGTYSRKNRLYFAFRELGRAVRTGFLLDYLSNQQLRSTIQAATNKSEAFNGFTKWVFFAGEGIIGENNRDEQRKIIKYNHLVSTLLIFHTVYSLTRVLEKLQKQGHEFDDGLLSMVSPYLTEHINRFGNYTLNLKRKTPPLGLALPKAGKQPPARHLEV